MPIALDTLPMGEEALWDDKMQIVLGAGHRDIKQSALPLELEHRPSTPHASVKYISYSSPLLGALPNAVKAAKTGPRGIEMVDVAVKDGNGKLLPGAIPVVTISADGGYTGMEYGHDTAPEVDLMASIEHKLSLGLLTGFVIQGLVPYGRTPSHRRHKLMLKAAFNGIPVAMSGRGAPMGFADPADFQIVATNLTAMQNTRSCSIDHPRADASL